MGTNLVRPPAVAGRFYPRTPDALLDDLRSYLSPPAVSIPALGCVVPHAGYVYSGYVAGAVYARLEIPERCILLCPNHTGLGPPLSIMAQGVWETPLGRVAIDHELAAALIAQFPLLVDDADAHRHEHAIEVQLPFLQAKRAHLSFVPIAIGTRQYDTLAALGDAIGEIVAASPEPILVLASSDMNHFESDSITRVKDQHAIERILALDARGLNDVVVAENISMCGYGPTIAMLTAARRTGATSAELIKYATSADISGERDRVVGYAGIVIT